MFADKSTGSNVNIMHNGKFLCNITLNMALFHYNVSHNDCSASGALGDDVDNDAILPQPIGHFEDDDDADSNDIATIGSIIFCEDDGDTDVVVPSILLFCSYYSSTDCIGILMTTMIIYN